MSGNQGYAGQGRGESELRDSKSVQGAANKGAANQGTDSTRSHLLNGTSKDSPFTQLDIRWE